MKTFKIFFLTALLFSSCLSVDHENRRYNAEGLTYQYGFHFVNETLYEFNIFFEDGDQDESYTFEQLSDSTWKCSYNHKSCCLTGQIIKYEDNDTVSFSFEGYDISDGYSLHVFTTEDIVYRRYNNYIAGTVRLEILQNNQLIGWGQLVRKNEKHTITTGTE